MKKLMIVPVLVLGLLFTTNLSAQDDRVAEKESAMLTVDTAEQQKDQKKFSRIERNQIPNAVNDAVTRDYRGATIVEAHVSEDKSTYKLVITVGEERKTLYADANGNWKKKE